MSKKIVITGATGLIGIRLCRQLIQNNNDVTVFTSDVANAKRLIIGAHEYIKWDYYKPDEWQEYLNGKDAVIHLAGASIAGKRWTADYKKTILESRVVSTQNLGSAFKTLKQKPEVFISSSAVGYYGNSGDEILTEDSKNGSDFLSDVCRQWEYSAGEAEKFGIRTVSIRTGIVLSKNGGALKQMLLPYKFFAGGHPGSGKQWFPWIHIEDLIAVYLFSLNNPYVKGPVNAVSPNPVTAKEFAKNIGKTIHRPSLFPVPLFVLKLAVGEVAESIVASQRAIPQKLSDAGFKFKFEKVDNALKDLLN